MLHEPKQSMKKLLYLSAAIVGFCLFGCKPSNVQPDEYPATDSTDHNPKVHGIDVSHHNDLDWEQLKKFEQLQFLYAKATEGATFQDDRFDFHRQFAREHKLKFGGYHFLTLKSHIDSQFVNYKTMMHDFDCLPMLDVEGWDIQHLDTLELQGLVDRWIELTSAEWGVKPIIYCNPKIYHMIDLRGCLWWADMGVCRNPNNVHTEEPTDPYAIWQFSVYKDSTVIHGVRPDGTAVADSVDVNFLRPGSSLRDILMPPKNAEEKK